MTKFGSLDQNGRFIELGEVEQGNMRKCPHFIMEFSHYRADGTCRCDDPSHLDMGGWGYEWDTNKMAWIAPEDDDDS